MAENSRYSTEAKRRMIEEYRYFRRDGLNIRQAVLRTQEFYRANFGTDRCPTRWTILNLNTKWVDGGSILNKKPPGRNRTAQTAPNLRKIESKVRRNRKISTRNLAAVMPISRSSCMRILKKEGYGPKRATPVQKLTPADCIRRVAFCREMIERIAEDDDFLPNILFTDEKVFQLNGATNSRNDVEWWKENPHREVIREKRKQPSIMVWAGLWAGGILKPIFIEGNITGKTYLHMLRTKVVPELADREVLTRLYFQHDGATPHHTGPVMEFLNETFEGRVIGKTSPIDWPPNSPDMTPPDFYLWGTIQSRVKKQEPKTINDLKRAIRAEFRALQPSEIRRSCMKAAAKFQQCLDREGAAVGKGLKN
ncbi:unnamed protein product [Allacma fusca]|uniref:Transposase n=1 Tax=Allacma fusca TaxID=39272 RepID=A0A8J2JRG1_9HEXA|nr:unnamed protein product [Allacma fusca]